MHGAKQRGCHPLRVKAGGDAHIVDAKALRKGMSRAILAAAVPVIAETGDHIHPKIPLSFFIIGEP